MREVLDAAVPALTAAGCDTPRLDAELLVADALGADRATVVASPELPIPPAAARLLSERVRRRVGREPVAYILGRKGFRRIELAVDVRVLIPRPETELLVEVALGLPQGARVHDVGTGSGAVALALLDERPDLVVSASDSSAAAVAVARDNAARLGLPLTVTEARGLPAGEFDLVLANLPYVREDEWAGLEPEITRFEPPEALVSGSDGLDAIRELVAARRSRNAAGARARARPGGRGARAPRGRRDPPRPRGARAGDGGHGAVNAEDVETFRRCISVGGVALFPADTVYGLATEPHSREGVDRIYGLKGRRAERPSAVMFFGLELALAALPEIGEETARALGRLLPGPVTVVLPQPRPALPARLRTGARAPRPAGAAARG